MIYRKTWGNTFFGIKEKEVQIGFKGKELVMNFTGNLDKDTLKRFVLWTILETSDHDELWQHQNYIYIAVKEALTSASNRGQYHYRCHKCRHWNRVPGQKCALYDPKAFLSIACDKFELKESIRNYLAQRPVEAPLLKEEYHNTFCRIGCNIDVWEGKAYTHYKIQLQKQVSMWRCLTCGRQFRTALEVCTKCGSFDIEEFDPLHDEPQMPS